MGFFLNGHFVVPLWLITGIPHRNVWEVEVVSHVVLQLATSGLQIGRQGRVANVSSCNTTLEALERCTKRHFIGLSTKLFYWTYKRVGEVAKGDESMENSQRCKTNEEFLKKMAIV